MYQLPKSFFRTIPRRKRHVSNTSKKHVFEQLGAGPATIFTRKSRNSEILYFAKRFAKL